MESIIVLILEILLVSFIIVLLYSQRKRFGLVLLFIFIGSIQYLQTILSATIYIQIFQDFYFSPGSAILFSASIFTILLIYIKEGVRKTRTLIYAIVFTNIILTIFSGITSLQLNSEGIINVLEIPKALFEIDAAMFLIGTFLLIVDSILLIVIYELILFKLKKIWLFWVIIIPMFSILYADSIVFSALTFQSHDFFSNIFIGNLIAKSISGFIFSIVLYIYITRIDQGKFIRMLKPKTEIKDIFSIISYRDRYESLKVEKRLIEDAKNNLVQSNRNKDKFFSVVSHDLRSPIATVVGFLNFLQKNFEQFTEKELKDHIKTIHESSKDALELLTNLLEWSSIQMNKMQVSPVSFPINEAIHQSVKLLSENANKKQISIQVKTIRDFDVYADKNMISSIIRNLLSNAIKFSHPGGQIIVDVSEREYDVLIKVIDHGVGIPKEVMKKLFEENDGFSTYGTSNEVGTGLGLVLSSEFIKLNGGSIAVNSQVGKGSTFEFSVPPSVKELNK